MAGSGYKQLNQDSASAVTATRTLGNELGDERIETSPHRRYMFVYNDGGSDISPGFGCVLVSGATNYSVTVTSVTSVTPCFGVVRHSTLTTATYGWVLKQGFVQLEADAETGLAVNDRVILGDAGVHTRITGATGTLTPIHGIVAQATASAGSGFGYVNCL